MYTALEVAVALQSDVREKSLEPIEAEIQQLNKQILDTLNK
jgi:hypothetical protein